MKLRISVGFTQEWAERALPMLEEAGLRQVGLVTAAEGEYVECDFDYEGREGLDAGVLAALLGRVRACVAGSMVPHADVTFVAD